MSNSKEYSSKINEMSKNTTESLLDIGLVFVDAKKNLDDSGYEQFLEETSYMTETSTVRKWICIGNSYIRLKPIANLLPPTFSVIYKVSTLDASQVDLLVKEDVLKQSVTLKEINDSLKTASQKRLLPIATLKFDSQIDLSTFVEIIDSINSMIDTNSIVLKLNADAENLYQSNNDQLTKKVA